MSAKHCFIQRILPKLLRVAEALESLFGRWSFNPTQTLSASPSKTPVHLFITHGRGGGSEHYTKLQAQARIDQGEEKLVMSFSVFGRCFIINGNRFFSARSLLKFLSQQHISQIHLHHTRYFPYSFVQNLPKFAKSLNAAYEVTLHDFMSFCPRIHLMDNNWLYCGMPTDPAACNRCIAKNGILTSAPSRVQLWRATWHNILKNARAVYAPSIDTASRHRNFFPDIVISAWQEQNDTSILVSAPASARPRAGGIARIALVGNIHELKGAPLLLACAQDAKERTLPIEFCVIGNCARAAALKELGVYVSGPYQQDQLKPLLNAAAPHVIFLASTWPETYSYVLSEIWHLGYFPVAFDFGAPAERIRASGKGLLISHDLMDKPAALNNKLLELMI